MSESNYVCGNRTLHLEIMRVVKITLMRVDLTIMRVEIIHSM
jgi:hypothetical protein